MSIALITAVVGGAILIILGSGIYVGVGLGAVGILGFELLAHKGQVVSAILYNSLGSYSLAAVPMYLFMGNMAFYGGLTGRLYQGVSQWTRIIPGGLIQSNIMSCAIFAAVCGSSSGTAATIGTVAYPEQKARGYDTTLAVGSLAAGGTLGILIPPSLPMILYGSFVGVSVGRLFIGGIIPGVLLALAFMIYIFFAAVRNPSLGPPRQRVRPRYFLDAMIALKDIWPVLLIIVSILGTIYLGVATPTEAAALSAILVILMAAALGTLNFNVVKAAALAALRTTAMVLLIMLGASILGNCLSILRIPAQLSALVMSMGLGRMWVWLAIVILYLILGCFMDGPAMMLLTLPIIFPIVTKVLGFDPVWFGVVLVMLIECGCVTPPVGLNLFVLQGISGTDLWTVTKGAFPFFLVMLVMIAVVTFVPEVILFLPNMMIR